MSELERWPGPIFAPLLYWWRAWGLGETRFAESLLSATSTSNTWVCTFRGQHSIPPKRLPVWDTRIKAGVTRIDWNVKNIFVGPLWAWLWFSLPLFSGSVGHLLFTFHIFFSPFAYVFASTFTLSSCPVALGPWNPGRISSPPHHYPSLLSPQPTLPQCPWK